MLDADLQQYFDTIAHDKLMKMIAERISDRHILNWIKQWLSAAVVEEDQEGKRQTRKPKRGTPQGGVISPLLANVYLNLCDRMFRSYCQSTGLAAELVRYADDFVILMRGRVERTEEKVKQMLEELALKLNEDKTPVLDARQQSFEFLGFSFQRPRSSKSGKMIVVVEPSRKSEQRFRDKVRSLTARWTHCSPQHEVVEGVNRYVQGWVNYFHLHNSTRVFARQRFFLEQRMRKYLQKRRQRRGNGMKQWPASRLYKELGRCAIPVYARYRRVRMP